MREYLVLGCVMVLTHMWTVTWPVPSLVLEEEAEASDPWGSELDTGTGTGFRNIVT